MYAHTTMILELISCLLCLTQVTENALYVSDIQCVLLLADYVPALVVITPLDESTMQYNNSDVTLTQCMLLAIYCCSFILSFYLYS